MDFFFQNNSVENSLICPRTKSASHCLTELFPIYQNKHWTIRRRDDHIVVQSSHRNIFKIDRFQVTRFTNIPVWHKNYFNVHAESFLKDWMTVKLKLNAMQIAN